MSSKSDRPHIIDSTDGSEVPYLRGIMTRSLQKVGLGFEEAYAVADQLREQLNEVGDVTSEELRSRVMKVLGKRGLAEARERYEQRAREQPVISVMSRGGTASPFSKGQLADSMEICALGRERSYEIITALESRLTESGKQEISSSKLFEMTVEAIREFAGAKVAAQYRRWVSYSRSGQPVILLVGGTTGCGKSTISSELAHRLNIVRTQSTDMLREVMRLMIPRRLIPTLHTSSFLAYRALSRFRTGSQPLKESAMVEGYLNQCDQVAVGIDGVLSRAMNERVSLIIEGVHLHPALQKEIQEKTDALVVPITIAVLGKKYLKKQLTGRGQQISSRRSERYLNNFDKIWELQSFLLSEADRNNIPIVANEDEEETIHVIMQIVSEHLERYLNAHPEVAQTVVTQKV